MLFALFGVIQYLIMEDIWTIRLKNNGMKYLVTKKIHNLTWGHFKNAITFSSKYKCKQFFREISIMAECEMFLVQ